MSETALTKIDQLGMAVAKATERRVIRKARKIIERGIQDAASINDDGLDDSAADVLLDEHGRVDERRRRIAKDLRKPKRDAPMYLDVSVRMLESHDKIEAARNHGPRTQLNNYTVINFTPPTYETISLDPLKEDPK